MVDIITIRKLKTLMVGSVSAVMLYIFWISESMYKYNHVGSLVAESIVDSSLYIGLVRLRPFVGSDYVTMNLLDFLLPSLVYKYMTMVDLKREEWLLANRLLFSSEHPSYANITARAMLISAVLYVALTGLTISTIPFGIIFFLVEVLAVLIALVLQDDLEQFLLFGKKLDAVVPNLIEEEEQGAAAELQHVLIDEEIVQRHEAQPDQVEP